MSIRNYLNCVTTIWLVLFYYKLAYSELNYCSIALFVSCLKICFHVWFSACQLFLKASNFLSKRLLIFKIIHFFNTELVLYSCNV